MAPQPSRRAEHAALFSILVTVALVIAKFIAWMATGSLAVLSQALDSLLDLVALGVVYVGVRVARKPADSSHHYGHGKAENLAAFAQTLLIGVVVVVVVWEAVRRLMASPPEVTAPWYAIALIAVSIIVDAGRVAVLTSTARKEDSDALRAGALNIAGDLGTAVVALVSLFLVRADMQFADPLGALVVVAVVTVIALKLARRSIDVLMDRAPEDRLQDIERAAAATPGVREATRIRLRGSRQQLFADVTVTAGRTASLERAHDIAEGVEREIQKIAPGSDVVVHVEPFDERGDLVERAQAAAGRTPEVHEVHNVAVHAFDDDGTGRLHVTLHAKVRGEMTVEEAHSVSDDIERNVADELDRPARVDTHLEPLDPTTSGHDVTGDRGDIVEALLAAARREPEVVDCHDIAITETSAGLTVIAHLSAFPDLGLSRVHDAASRIETRLLAEHPEITSVVLHLEPPENDEEPAAPGSRLEES